MTTISIPITLSDKQFWKLYPALLTCVPSWELYHLEIISVYPWSQNVDWTILMQTLRSIPLRSLPSITSAKPWTNALYPVVTIGRTRFWMRQDSTFDDEFKRAESNFHAHKREICLEKDSAIMQIRLSNVDCNAVMHPEKDTTATPPDSRIPVIRPNAQNPTIIARLHYAPSISDSQGKIERLNNPIRSVWHKDGVLHVELLVAEYGPILEDFIRGLLIAIVES